MKKESNFENILVKMGLKLADLRKKKGYTSHETFAYDYELSRMQYWRIEKGKTNLTIKSLMRLLEIHNLTLKEFINSLPKD